MRASSKEDIVDFRSDNEAFDALTDGTSMIASNMRHIEISSFQAIVASKRFWNHIDDCVQRGYLILTDLTESLHRKLRGCGHEPSIPCASASLFPMAKPESLCRCQLLVRKCLLCEFFVRFVSSVVKVRETTGLALAQTTSPQRPQRSQRTHKERKAHFHGYR